MLLLTLFPGLYSDHATHAAQSNRFLFSINNRENEDFPPILPVFMYYPQNYQNGDDDDK